VISNTFPIKRLIYTPFLPKLVTCPVISSCLLIIALKLTRNKYINKTEVRTSYRNVVKMITTVRIGTVKIHIEVNGSNTILSFIKVKIN
jgi:phage gp36-like protein